MTWLLGSKSPTTTEFPYYGKILYKPKFSDKPKGKPVVFDMDMSAGDLLSLIYLLKAPTDLINLQVQFIFLK